MADDRGPIEAGLAYVARDLLADRDQHRSACIGPRRLAREARDVDEMVAIAGQCLDRALPDLGVRAETGDEHDVGPFPAHLDADPLAGEGGLRGGRNRGEGEQEQGKITQHSPSPRKRGETIAGQKRAV